MKSILIKFLFGVLAFHVMVISWFIFFLGDQSFISSSFWATIVGFGTYFGLQYLSNRKKLATNQLSRQDYQYIMKNLKEAQAKKKRLNKALFGVRSVDALKEIGQLNRSVSRVLKVVKKEPARFYEADHFFFYQLDSVVQLTEKYTFLASHSLKDEESKKALQETEDLIRKLTFAVEKELATILSSDFEDLSAEREIAEHSIHLQKSTIPEKVKHHD
ncbi:MULTISPECIES: 5-bromo-4-chloroindolyl phosphate hydrolysis family protein [Pontibacillus]|uniref:5-bromo-4-chloroindolyl phosphate hydrolysis family protein n=1 Tax=Pontibacillus chungwhensis TaxID=265426 RepID=A0ABY8V0A5_9BACI|nr:MULTISPECIES: 5-bromo-4-chloroindolyl phosphate hydrolysis family protein [Pontibacillus]MCD5324322.1 5-bromo-4-chloroindolyl phosphate hydrolysis family protein [Pontibacillus sp. HN14]WIF99381.1 5-bromo-4-chloroindolyl phosphate hydrolysis family protein [Pontibacillus chungwhensis]